ncbi:MAG: glycosyltransferase family 2 protein [Candidatus Pacebacteria bacterium]|nr:glycosyltransferase family 2 protein [Candidatus Paceibacterota bacterium]PIR59926.1 MAG: glycosyl transferase [Candidatus Pacebacteria bacterium CG10_big_fil_rev_8_21_14_0_10_44_54]
MKNAIKLSVLIPIYNEQQTLKEVLQKVLAVKQVSEVVVVDDGSTDRSPKILAQLKHKKLKIFRKENGGKGSAIRYALKHATGTHILIQDADLEYDPEDITALLEPIRRGRVEVVYGSRFLGPHLNLLFWHRVGNSLLNFLVNILFNTTLSDMETCYKVVPTKVMHDLNLVSNSFDIEPEITCKLLKRGIKIFEVPISYIGRDFSEGKKITWLDGISAVQTIIRLRLAP